MRLDIKKLIKVSGSMFKIGCIGFGGGSALIPIMEKEAVDTHGFMNEEEYTNSTVIANITPGALPVKLGGLIGDKVAGPTGMLIGSVLTSLPGVLIMLVLLSTIAMMGEDVLLKIEYASVGISVFIITLLVHYIEKIMKDSRKNNFALGGYMLMVGTMVLTFGREIRHLFTELGLESAFTNSEMLFDISTIDILLLIFFVLFFTCGRRNRIRTPITVAVASIYVLSFGKAPLLPLAEFKLFFQIAMMVVALVTVVLDAKKENSIEAPNAGKIDFITPTKQSIPFIVATAVLYFACLFLTGVDPTYFFTNGLISVITSFGGGEAYLTVADGIFVAEGVVSSSEFYGQILPIANALPGSILVKILVGVGFISAGYESMVAGWIYSAFALMLATSASCVVCCYVAAIYNTFSNLDIFRVLKVWILPVICGLLLSTIVSMLAEASKITAHADFSALPTIILVVAVYVVVEILHKKFHLHDLLLIVIAAVGSLAVLSI